MASNNNTDTWNINTDIYDIVDSVNELKKRYIKDEDETTLSLGIFGFVADTESKKIQTATIMAGQLGNEMFPTRARLTKNILTHAAYNGITDFNAIPARITVTLCIKTSDVDKYIQIDDQNREYFYIDHLSPIFIEDYEFHPDFDIRVRRKKNLDDDGNITYSYSAMYIVEKEDPNDPTKVVRIINPISDITDPYIQQPFTINIGNVEHIGIQCTIRQCSIEEINDTMVSDTVIENKTYTFEFENQLADFRVTVVDNGKTVEMTPYMYGATESPDDEFYCWYIFTGDNKVRITFDNSSFIPGLNSQIYIKIYNTLGMAGNFEYLNVDETSEGLYVDLGTENYGYKNIVTYLVAVTDSVDGADRKSIEELKRLIPKAAMSRGNITTETDLNNYFNLINTDQNRLVLRKKEDNQLTRIWYGYFLLKDDYNNIIPTNTFDIMIPLGYDMQHKKHVIESSNGDSSVRYIIPAGTHFMYDPVTDYAYPIDEVGSSYSPNIPELYSDEYFNSGYYYYLSIYTIIINKDPLYCSYFLTSCDYDSYFTYEYVNQDSEVQFIANRFHVVRNILTSVPVYYIDFNIAQSVNDGSFRFVTTETQTFQVGNVTETDTVTSDNGKAILILYKNSKPYRWQECLYVESESDPDKALFHFRLKVTTNSEFGNDTFDDQNCLYIDGMRPAGDTTELYGYIPENCEARLFILAHIAYDATEDYPRENFDEVCPGYEDYSIVNVYKCVNGIRFFTDMTRKTNTRINTTPNNLEYDYRIDGVPMVGKHYMENELKASFLLEAINEKNAYIDYCLKLLENQMEIDFKFFNTYGESRTYKIGQKDTDPYIGNVDCTWRFKLSLKDTSDGEIVNQIKSDVKDYIENINNIVDFHAPNLITEITNKYEDRINFFEFVGFNDFDADDQHIIVGDNVDDIGITPEFINVRNIKDSATDELVPDITIELV